MDILAKFKLKTNEKRGSSKLLQGFKALLPYFREKQVTSLQPCTATPHCVSNLSCICMWGVVGAWVSSSVCGLTWLIPTGNHSWLAMPTSYTQETAHTESPSAAERLFQLCTWHSQLNSCCRVMRVPPGSGVGACQEPYMGITNVTGSTC